MVVEGMPALTGQHFIIDFSERAGTLPGFVRGVTNVARDEHRHDGVSVSETRAFALKALERRLAVIGLAAAAA